MCYLSFPVKRPRIQTVFLFALALGFLVFLGAAAWVALEISRLPDVRPLARVDNSFPIEVRDWEGNTASFIVGPRNPSWTPLQEIPDYLRRAVLAGEDFSFYHHSGLDWYEIYESFKRNLKEHRFARGGSTITQQLAKNLYLSREKTLRRKVKELFLTRRLEKTLSKDRILELYLNIVELGDRVHGVGHGARHHFGKTPAELTIRESAFLAAMLPGPRVYDPLRRLDRVMNRSDHILGVMLKGRWITEAQYLEALVEIPFPYGEAEDIPLQDTPPVPPGEGTVVPRSPESAGTMEVPGPSLDDSGSPAGNETAGEQDLPGRDGIIEIPVGGEEGND